MMGQKHVFNRQYHCRHSW